MIYRFQPRPIRTRVLYFRARGLTVTTLMREWRKGGPALCRLCDRCQAVDESCVLMIGERIEPDDAALFSTVGMPYQKSEPRPIDDGFRLLGGPDR